MAAPGGTDVHTRANFYCPGSSVPARLLSVGGRHYINPDREQKHHRPEAFADLHQNFVSCRQRLQVEDRLSADGPFCSAAALLYKSFYFSTQVGRRACWFWASTAAAFSARLISAFSFITGCGSKRSGTHQHWQRISADAGSPSYASISGSIRNALLHLSGCTHSRMLWCKGIYVRCRLTPAQRWIPSGLATVVVFHYK